MILPNRRGGAGRGIAEYDFGPILARGQTLRHEFTFTNSTKQPIRLTEATATTPCCSAVGPVPKEPIPPGGRCPIPVVLKALAYQTETKRVGFFIQTDSKDCPTLTYALRATFYPEWEIRASGESAGTLPVGRAGRRVMRITSRRAAGEGGSLPARVEAESPLAARFLGEPREQTDPDGVGSIVRDVEIALLPSSKPGPHLGTIRFRWPEGRTHEQTVSWEVVPPIRASPSNLIVKRAERDLPHTITIRSDGRPFRITSVGPPHLVVEPEFSHEPSGMQTLKLRIDPDRAVREKDPRITIHTNHPDQPTLSVGVLTLPSGE